jgi:hypothetical protein
VDDSGLADAPRRGRLHVEQQMPADESLRVGEVPSGIDNLYGEAVIHWR